VNFSKIERGKNGLSRLQMIASEGIKIEELKLESQ
jgi:hypothetical protein